VRVYIRCDRSRKEITINSSYYWRIITSFAFNHILLNIVILRGAFILFLLDNILFGQMVFPQRNRPINVTAHVRKCINMRAPIAKGCGYSGFFISSCTNTVRWRQRAPAVAPVARGGARDIIPHHAHYQYIPVFGDDLQLHPDRHYREGTVDHRGLRSIPELARFSIRVEVWLNYLSKANRVTRRQSISLLIASIIYNYACIIACHPSNERSPRSRIDHVQANVSPSD